MEAHLKGLFASLEASFDAAVDKQEEEAATDLALSLRQGTPQREFLARQGFTVAAREGTYRAIEVGLDHVLAEGARVFPLAACTAHLRADLLAPEVTDLRLIEVLRARVLDPAEVEVETAAQRLRGRLSLCGPDHLILITARGPVSVPLASVLSIRLSLED